MERRSYAPALIAELARVGATDVRVEMGGKHPRVRYVYNGRSGMYVFPSSPSDSQRGQLNALTELRRHLGVTAPRPVKKAPVNRAQRTHAHAQRTVDAPGNFTVAADPFLSLAAWRPPSRFQWVRTTGRTWRVDVVQFHAQET